MTTYKSNAARNLVELMEVEMRRFWEVSERFTASGVALPVTDDESYQSPRTLCAHVLRAARGYLTWTGEMLARPVEGTPPETQPEDIAARGAAFMEEVLACWRAYLPGVADSELFPAVFRTRWGEDSTIEQMLEHAVVHPMRHRIQLERLMREAGK